MNEPCYWWYKDEGEQSIWLVMDDGRITDGAFIYGRDEFDGEWIPVMRPEAIDAALEQSHDRGRAIGHMEGMAEEREARLPCGHPRPCIIPDKSGGRCAWCESLEQARVEERELARPLFEAVKKAMDEEYELSERTCDILWEAWCAYGLAIREAKQ